MEHYAGRNLERIMAELDLSVEEVVGCTGLDKRTVKAILDGRTTPRPRTIHRLAAGLGTPAGEFFLEPARLLYRRFDHETNPVVDEVVESHPDLFEDWTAADFDELHSRHGTGGPMTAEGALEAVRQINRKRRLHHKLSVLLETGHADLIAGIMDVLYERIMVSEE